MARPKDSTSWLFSTDRLKSFFDGVQRQLLTMRNIAEMILIIRMCVRV